MARDQYEFFGRDSFGNPLRPTVAAVDVSGAGVNAIVAAVAGKRVRVVQYQLTAFGTGTLQFTGVTGAGAQGATVTGPMSVAVNSVLTSGFCPTGLFDTAAGEGLALVLPAVTPERVGGWISYVVV